MANSYIKPQNGKIDPNVQTVNGKLAFSIPLCQLETASGAVFPLELNYRSNSLKDEYSTWSEESTTGLIAAGWGINIGDRIYTVSLAPKKYALYFNGVNYLLDNIGTENGVTKYKTHVHSDFSIQYNNTENVWNLFSADGIEYIFGKNDTYNTEKGDYSIQTGTYTQASEAYIQIRKLISSPNDQGIPAKASADNTICRATESMLFGAEDWIGPCDNLGNMNEKSSSWLLSHIVDRFDNLITFSYIQHISNLCNSNNSKTYSVASYLYQITAYTKDTVSEKVIFNYALKDTNEYNIDYVLTERPNGMQQKFEKLLINKIDYYVFGQKKEQYLFNYTLTNPLDNAGSTLIKRQLAEIYFLAKDSADVLYQPSYKMEYYGNQDGVSVGKAGFDESHPYFNAENGALYGNLKSITYPSGEKRIYKYAQKSICSVNNYITLIENTDEDPIFYHTAYNYSIKLVKSKDKTTMQFFAYTWTLNGWQEELLCTRKYEKDYNFDRLMSFSEHFIGIIATPRNETQANKRCYAIFNKNVETDKWVTRQVFETDIIYGPDKNLSISVSDYGFAVTGRTNPSDLRGTIHAAFTSNLGETFNKVDTYSVSNLTSSNLYEYTIGLQMMEDRYLAFVFTDMQHPNSTAPNQSPLPESYYYLKIGGYRSNNTKLPVSDLGRNTSQYLNHHYQYTQNNYQTNSYVYAGSDIINMKKIVKMGNLFSIEYQTSYQISHYSADSNQDPIHQIDDTVNINWIVIVMNTGNFDKFDYAYLQTGSENPLFRRFSKSISANDRQYPVCSAMASGNGMIFAIYYMNEIGEILSNETIFFTYQGGNHEDFHVQTIQDGANTCVRKDDTFAVFETQIKPDVYQKTYYYYNPSTIRWSKINTGSVSKPSISYNKDAQTAVEVLNVLGLLLFLFTMPFGVGEILGAIMTVLSLALMAGTYIAESIFEQSMKASLNLSCSYYGNRFINDGETIWFRENSQDRLTAVGSGESYQPYDSLSGSDIKGNILTEKQGYGLVYNFVPFLTDQKKLYYRNLKNNAVGPARCINLFANGFNDVYYDYNSELFHFYIGTHKFQVSKDFQTITPVITHPYFNTVEACALLKRDQTSSRKGNHLLTFSGGKFCYETLGNILPPMEIREVIQNCTLTHVDCALEKRTDSISDVVQFYLFSENCYELVDFTNTNSFRVIEKGTINILYNGLTFDRLDAAFNYLDNVYFVKGNDYIAYNITSRTKTDSGKIGVDFMNMDLSDIAINFSQDTLSFFNRASKTTYLQKFTNGSFSNPIEDYTVDTVEFYTNPSMGNSPSCLTHYEYQTSYCSYSLASKTAIYPRIEISTADEFVTNVVIHENGETYHLDNNGIRVAGWKEWNGERYYFDNSQDCRAAKGWKELSHHPDTESGIDHYSFDRNSKTVANRNTIHNKMYYFDLTDGKAVKGWNELSGRPDTDGEVYHYYFYSDTHHQLVASGLQIIDGEEFYLNSIGGAMVGVIQTENGLKYFAPANTIDNNLYGQAVNYTAWLDLDGNKYYFDNNFKAVTGWYTIDNQMYYFNPTDGKAVKGWNELSDRPGTDEDFYYYYFDPNTCKQLVTSGLQVINGKEFYLNSTGGAMTGVFNTPNGFEYFAPANVHNNNLYGQAIYYTGWLEFNEAMYYFTGDSKAVKNWRQLSRRPGTDGGSYYYYFDPNTCKQHIASGYQVINGKDFYLNSTGGAMTGVFNTPNGFEYFAPANTHNNNPYGQAIYYTGWLTFDGAKYYFAGNSKAVTGWKEIDDNIYYFNPTDGKAVKGWNELIGHPYSDGKSYYHYYFNTDTCAQFFRRGYCLINNKEFYLNSSGGAMTGVFNTPNGFEYFAPANTHNNNLYGQAIYYTGWLFLGSAVYYFEANSKAVTGWKNIDGIMFHFDEVTACLIEPMIM